MTADHKPIFCTVYNCRNEYLIKSVGLNAYGMSELEGYDSWIATYDNEKDYPYLKDIPGVSMMFIKNATGNFHRDSTL